DSALLRQHQERLLRAPVEGDREVVLLRDLRGPFDPELADDVAADVEAEDVARASLGLGRVVGELHAARLAAPARQDLRLDDDLRAELLGGRAGKGRVEVAGHDVVRHPNRVRRSIGYVPQESGVDRDATGRENLLLQGRIQNVPRDELRARVDELLELVGIADAADRVVRGY